MECSDTERLIDAYLDRELSPKTANQVESHLASCAACRSKYGPMLELLRSPEPVSPPRGLNDRIVAAVNEQADRTGPAALIPKPPTLPARFNWPPWLGAVAACLTFFVMGWISSQLLVHPTQHPVEQTKPSKQEHTTIVLSPWLLNSWAQAMALRGPANPMPLLFQAAVTELMFETPIDTTPAIHVRRHPKTTVTVEPDTAEPQTDYDFPVLEIPFFPPVYRL